MNPQNVSSSFLIATGHIRAMRGGALLHMLTASDGHAYVVKFANNPQSVRVLANEWIASSIGRTVGLPIPEPAILYVLRELVESSPSLVIRLSSSTLKCSDGLAFGSRVISGDEVFDYLPESASERIENRQEFVGACALDKWLCNCDGRQVVFCRRERNRNFRAHFIDFGYCFNAEECAPAGLQMGRLIPLRQPKMSSHAHTEAPIFNGAVSARLKPSPFKAPLVRQRISDSVH